MEFQSGLKYKRNGCILVQTVRSIQDSLTIADAVRKIYPKITPIFAFCDFFFFLSSRSPFLIVSTITIHWPV